MSTLTTQPPRAIAIKPVLMLLLLLAIGALIILNIGRDTAPVDAINTAMEQGIAITTPLNGCSNFKLKDFKKPAVWRKQFRKRGFTVDKVKDMLQSGNREFFIDPNGRQMVRIIDPQSGDYLVLDPHNCEIFQIAPAYFKH